MAAPWAGLIVLTVCAIDCGCAVRYSLQAELLAAPKGCSVKMMHAVKAWVVTL